jgi:hypothetical protein
MRFLAIFVLAAAALVVPTGATAATVVNGDFETGTFSGWQLLNPDGGGGPEEDSWYVYSGTNPPGPTIIESVAPPPGGNFAAVTSQGGPGSHYLYQDVALEPFWSHQLSLVAYYRSEGQLFTPSPASLDPGTAENQQYRIDVMNPAAPIESVNPADILATVFATKTGDPQELGPTTLTADLTPVAGQIVRLRFVEVDNQNYFAASTDNVSILSTPPSNVVVLGKPTLNKKKGTAKLPVTVPGAGTLTIADVKATKKRVKAKTVTATAPGTLNLPVKPTKSARTTLKDKGKLKLKVAVTFTPTGGFAAAVTRKLTLKLAPK